MATQTRNYRKLARMMSAFNDETRLQIMEKLYVTGEGTLESLSAALDISPINTRNHMAKLELSDIVEVSKDGRVNRYTLNTENEGYAILFTLFGGTAAQPTAPEVPKPTAGVPKRQPKNHGQGEKT